MVWPISNRSDDLQIDYHYLRRQIGAYLGYGYSHSTWNDQRQEEVQDIIDEGVRSYAFPPPLTEPYVLGRADTHEWTWLRPTLELTTVASQRRYDLPDTFDRPIGDVTFADEENNRYMPLAETQPHRLDELENRVTTTTVPEYYAIEPGQPHGQGPQRKILVLHPTPDDEYKLRLKYQSIVNRMTEDRPYPPGGQSHGSGILASCLAAAELRKIGQQGPMWQNFMSKLTSDIIRDRKRMPRLLGYNGDGSIEFLGRGALRRLDGIYYGTGTYNGTLYTG